MVTGSRRKSTGAPLAPYLPRLALDWAATAPEDRWCAIDGSLVFADVSGFTALSERLARRGAIGAEELTEALGGCFRELLSVAYAAGGSLLKFGGDALLLLFDGDGHAARAATAAQGMRVAMRTAGRLTTSVGGVRLRMSVGVHSGTLHLFRVGASHKELIVAGPAATETVEMEAAASAGEVVVSLAAAARLDPRLVGEAKGGGRLLRDRNGPARASAYTDVGVPPADLATSIPRALRDHLLGGGSESEHRLVTIAFVHFEGIDARLRIHGPAAVAGALEEFMGAVQSAADDNGVTFLCSDIDTDGGKVVLVAGAPRALDDGEGRMLSALRTIADAPSPLPVRIGLHRGRVFAGEIGPDYRRTYTVMGDAVNVAARLMAKAEPGQILATGDVVHRARDAYQTEALEPFMVKGKSRPVEAVAIGARLAPAVGRSAYPAEALPFFGREKALAALIAAFDTARRGAAQVVEITAEAGLGKSRLLAELARRIDSAHGARVVAVRAEPYEASTPWYVTRQLLLDVLGLEPAPSADLGGALRRRLGTVAPAMLPWLPLLADVIGADVDPTREVSDLEPRFRRQRTGHAVVDVLAALCPGPTVLAFEDVQWADDASIGALRRLASTRREQPWLVVTTRRPGEAGFRAGNHATLDIVLEPLDDEASAGFVRAATADAPRRGHEVEAIVRRAGGNPLFLQELVRGRAGTGTGDELPDSIEAVIAASVDRLAPRDRRLLRYAAVLGVDVETSLLAELVGRDELPSPLHWRRFDDFIAVEDRGRLRFRSRLVRDVAYETLPFRRRCELHGRAGAAIEAAAGGSAERRAELLSLHFLNAQHYEKCWHYARLGAARAREQYANVEEAQLLERALLAAHHLENVTPQDAFGVCEAQADAWQRAGDLGKAKAAYASARRLVSDEPAAMARIFRRQARVAEAEGQPTAAARWLGRGLRLLEGRSDPAVLSERAELQAVYGWMRQRRGRHREALRWGATALDTALAAGNRSAAAHAYLLLDWAHVDLGQHDEAVFSDKALAIWEEDGHLSQQAFALNAMGAFAYYRGDWDQAAALYQRALDAYRRAGNEIEAAMARYNSAEILLEQGRLDEAEATLHEVVSVYRAVGYRAGLAMTSRDLGRIAAYRGDLASAQRLLEESRETFAAYRAGAKVLEVDAHRADVLLRLGRVDDALAVLNETLAQAATAGTATVIPLLHRVHGQAWALAGQLEAAGDALGRSLEAASAAGARYDIALALESTAWVARLRGEEPDQADEDERTTLLSRLGVRATPVLPAGVR